MSRGAIQFDLLVVGAGPAGASAAAFAARNGLRVALIDKARFPRNKLCGGGLTGRALRYYQQAFGQAAPDVPMRRFDSIEFWAFGQDLGTIQGAPPLQLTMRYDLDDALVAQAIALGARDFTGHRPTCIDPEAGTVDLGHNCLHAPIIIAADGVNSALARQVFGKAFDHDQIGFALEVEHPEPDPNANLRIDFGAAAWGYGWSFPKHTGTTIGLGGVLRHNPDMKAALHTYLARLGVAEGANVQGQFLPFGAYRPHPSKHRVLFAGDAAGLVDPITGEGIAYAIRSGHMAAETAIAHRDSSDRVLARNYKSRLRPIHRAIRQARMIRPLLFQDRFQSGFVRAFRSSQTLRDEYLRLLNGDIEYGGLTRALALRLPRHLWRTLINSGRE